MRARLVKLAHPPHVIAAGWEGAEVTQGHDTVLAATMPAFFDHPEAFLARCRAWGAPSSGSCRRMPDRAASASPAACCPNGEDERPGIDITMRGLVPASHPPHVAFADWTFTGVVPDLWSFPPISPIASVGPCRMTVANK